MQKISLFDLFIFEIKSILSPVTRLATPIFDHAHPIHFWSAFNIYESVSACKKSANSICSFLSYSPETILQSRDQIGQTHFMSDQTFSSNFYFFLNFYQHAKIKAVSLICSGEILDLKILQFYWFRTFWPISLGQRFFRNTGFVQEHSK